jgi:hypothetical protein
VHLASYFRLGVTLGVRGGGQRRSGLADDVHQTRPLPEEAFRLGMRLLDEELEMLKRLLETTEPVLGPPNVPLAEQTQRIGGAKRVRVK